MTKVTLIEYIIKSYVTCDASCVTIYFVNKSSVTLSVAFAIYTNRNTKK